MSLIVQGDCMISVAWLTVPIADLNVGLPLRYDIFSENGEQIARLGERVTQHTKSSWGQLGFDRVYAKVVTEAKEDIHFQAYDTNVVQRLERNLNQANQIIGTVASNKKNHHTLTSLEFAQVCGEMLNSIQSDSSAALFLLASSLIKQTDQEAIQVANRCSQMSLLAMTIAYELGLVPAECQAIGTVAMLHDISLMAELDSDVDRSVFYRQHPLRSARIVQGIVGLPAKVISAVAQVHETMLGDGYPQGVYLGKYQRIAKVVGVADAFLTLTRRLQPESMPAAMNFHPADAVGYLMYQAIHGRYDTEIVKALISSGSLYPIGSSVILNDQTTATVHRSTKTAGSKPVIRRESDNSLIDLRYSQLKIAGPNRNAYDYQPLRKSQLDTLRIA
ncbi:MAG: HD domain-containing phosphohydrolase [Pirellulales bacterium]